MSGGGGQSTATSYDIDKGQLAEFMKTGEGQKYAQLYNPKNNYAQIGDSIQSYDPDKITGDHLSMYGKVGNDVIPLINAFKSWTTGVQQTKANWDNYATAVNANEGGQGDNTITAGAAVSQRKVLLGSLANAGSPTTPTPGLGSMGVVNK